MILPEIQRSPFSVFTPKETQSEVDKVRSAFLKRNLTSNEPIPTKLSCKVEAISQKTISEKIALFRTHFTERRDLYLKALKQFAIFSIAFVVTLVAIGAFYAFNPWGMKEPPVNLWDFKKEDLLKKK